MFVTISAGFSYFLGQKKCSLSAKYLVCHIIRNRNCPIHPSPQYNHAFSQNHVPWKLHWQTFSSLNFWEITLLWSSPLPRTPFLLKLWCFPSSFTGPFLFSLKILCPLKCSFINYYQYDYNSQVSISSPKLPPKYNIVVMNIFKLVRTSFKPSPYFQLHDLFSSIQWDAFLIYTMK